MTVCFMIIAAYFLTISLVTTHLTVPEETKATIWWAVVELMIMPRRSGMHAMHMYMSMLLALPLCQAWQVSLQTDLWLLAGGVLGLQPWSATTLRP